MITSGAGYFNQMRTNWRPLLGALIGLATGYSFSNSMASVMAPHLIAEFGWSKASFAAVSGLSLIMVLAFPIVGRLTDMLGVRRTAPIGVVTLAVAFLLLSRMNGDIRAYMAVFLVQALICVTTTATVYSRIVVQYVEKARGLALAIVASGPALAGAVGGPLLNNFVEANGWRAGYLVLAAVTILGGAIALLMLPPERPAPAAGSPMRAAKKDYREIFRQRPFWILLVAMLLCNLPQVIVLTQLNLLMLENGVATADASVMISALWIGMLIGRFLCGVAIDRLPPHLVATSSMAGPSIGLFLIASNLDSPALLTFAVFLIGLSFGAEGDLVGFLVARYFGVRIYSSVMGLMTSAIATSSSTGALLLSATLTATDTFTLFLTICAISVLIGSLTLLLLKNATAPATAADRPAEATPAKAEA